jgi:hypothetical protein
LIGSHTEEEKEMPTMLPAWLDSTVRLVRGVYILLVLFLSIVAGSGSFHIPLLLIIWSVSSRYWRILNSTFIEMWYVQPPPPKLYFIFNI